MKDRAFVIVSKRANDIILCSLKGAHLKSTPYPSLLNLVTSSFVLSDSSGGTSERSAPSSSFSTGTALAFSYVLSRKSATTPSVITFEYCSTQ